MKETIKETKKAYTVAQTNFIEKSADHQEQYETQYHLAQIHRLLYIISEK